ncbi:MAG: hypothetical protein ABI867_15665 [Kofleriaceae bacterium]
MCALSACKWTAFDDLREEAWVNATDKPDNGSTNWGLAIQRGSQAGGKLVVLGTSQSVYNEIEYSANGDAKIAGTEVDLGDLGVANLDPQPILLADPASDDVALVTKTGPQQVLVLEGTSGQLVGHQVFGADSTDAATFMVAPGIGAIADPAQPAQPIVGALDTLYGTFYNPPEMPFMQVKCKLLDGATPIEIRALGAFRPTGAMTDDVAVWASNKKIYRVPGGVFNGGRDPGGACPDGNADGVGELDLTGVPQLDTTFVPEAGSQILVFGDTFGVIQGHSNAGGGSHLQVVDLATMAAVGNPVTEQGLRSAAVYAQGGQFAVVAGYPGALVDGVSCGKVEVYDMDTTTGIDGATVVETLNDAQPDDGQSFGRSVATLALNGQQVIAVGADNEVFLYFRTSTLYTDDVRTGR